MLGPTIKRIVDGQVQELEPTTSTIAFSDGNVTPAPGDDVRANNFVPLDDANAFFSVCKVLFAYEQDGQKKQTVVLPTRMHCDVNLRSSFVTFTLVVEVKNPQQDKTAAILLEIPRLDGLILLEEFHTCGEVEFLPSVMEKEKANKAFKQASASSKHSATLSNTGDSMFEIRVDKVSGGSTATLRTTFIQTQTRVHRRVMPSADETPQLFTDIVIVPGFTSLSSAAVPFTLTISHDPEFSLEWVSPDVLREDAKQMESGFQTSRAIGSLLAISPNQNRLSTSGAALVFESPCGFACGTLIKARFVQTDKTAVVGDEFIDVTASVDGVVKHVEMLEGALFSSWTGKRTDVSLVDVEIPHTLDTSAPDNQHDIYVIVDTSASTSECVNSRDTFLDMCKQMLDGILQVLPRHLHYLRSQQLVNSHPVSLRLYSFNTFTTFHHHVSLPAVEIDELDQLIDSVRAQVRPLASGGCTNYDSWSAKLRSEIAKHPTHLNHVLLLTDGGATDHSLFQSRIEDIKSIASGGSFQCDALGYGPWLNAQTVEFVTSATGGSAVMVEAPFGEQLQAKVLGLIARSLLRSAPKPKLSIKGGSLLAVHTISDGVGITTERSWLFAQQFHVYAAPSTRLRLCISHPPHGLALELENNALELPPVSSTNAQTGSSGRPVGGASKLSHPFTQKALQFLVALEPAYASPTSLFPSASESDRLGATLAISLLGQVVAPSVTKSCAVALLGNQITPVPSHCQPREEGEYDTLRSSTFDGVLNRGERLDLLDAKSADLEFHSQMFRKSASRVRSGPTLNLLSWNLRSPAPKLRKPSPVYRNTTVLRNQLAGGAFATSQNDILLLPTKVDLCLDILVARLCTSDANHLPHPELNKIDFLRRAIVLSMFVATDAALERLKRLSFGASNDFAAALTCSEEELLAAVSAAFKTQPQC